MRFKFRVHPLDFIITQKMIEETPIAIAPKPAQPPQRTFKTNLLFDDQTSDWIAKSQQTLAAQFKASETDLTALADMMLEKVLTNSAQDEEAKWVKICNTAKQIQGLVQTAAYLHRENIEAFERLPKTMSEAGVMLAKTYKTDPTHIDALKTSNRVQSTRLHEMSFYDKVQLFQRSKISVPKKTQPLLDDLTADSSNKAVSSHSTSRSSVSSGKRGSYRKYTERQREVAIDMARKHGITYASKHFKISRKNIKRWVRQGPMRRKGGGRKVQDPAMEERLINWIQFKAVELEMMLPIERKKEIKRKAKEMTNYPASFKASKGWLEKFCERYMIDIHDFEASIVSGAF